jgi:hypothetical protein
MRTLRLRRVPYPGSAHEKRAPLDWSVTDSEYTQTKKAVAVHPKCTRPQLIFRTRAHADVFCASASARSRLGHGEHRTSRTYPLDHPGKFAGGMITFTGALPLPAGWGRKSHRTTDCTVAWLHIPQTAKVRPLSYHGRTRQRKPSTRARTARGTCLPRHFDQVIGRSVNQNVSHAPSVPTPRGGASISQ